VSLILAEESSRLYRPHTKAGELFESAVDAGVRSQRIDLEEQAKAKTKLPSAAKLLEHLEGVKGELLGDEARATVILRQLLAGPIRVVPYIRVDRKKVVPRLEIDLNLVAVFLPSMADPLRRSMLDAEAAQPTLVTRSLLVDVFYFACHLPNGRLAAGFFFWIAMPRTVPRPGNVPAAAGKQKVSPLTTARKP
jgi:hypothetical protein